MSQQGTLHPCDRKVQEADISRGHSTLVPEEGAGEDW